MKLNSIALSNFRCYQDFKVDFGPGMNVIAGVNGSGKTSLLKAIRDALSVNVMRLGLPVATLTPMSEPDTAYIQADQVDGRWRFEPQSPVRIAAEAEFAGRIFRWTADQTVVPGHIQINGEFITEEVLKSASPITYPVLAFYPAYRVWSAAGVNEFAAATAREQRAAGYQNWWDASADSAALQQWAIAKAMERLQTATDLSVGWNGVIDDELAVVSEALGEVIGDAKGIRYDFAQKSLMIDWNHGKSPTPFRNLSDGQRVAIALISDIARRMCLLNPHLKADIAKLTPGIVLIDELDNHLHPKWQRLMVRGLVRAFPRVQFIAASHSPQVLSELQPENVILVSLDGASRPQASYGLDSNRILEQIMDAEPRPKEVEKALTDLFINIEQNNLSTAREQLAQLKANTPGLPEISGAEALIKRKEVLGR